MHNWCSCYAARRCAVTGPCPRGHPVHRHDHLHTETHTHRPLVLYLGSWLGDGYVCALPRRYVTLPSLNYGRNEQCHGQIHASVG